MTVFTVDGRPLADVHYPDTESMITLRDGRDHDAALVTSGSFSATTAKPSRWDLANAGRDIHWRDG